MSAAHPSETPHPAGRKRHRILIVEDHPLMREGIAKWIDHDPELEVCGEAGTAHEGLHAAEKLKPDLVLCDITLAGRSGLELVKDLRAVSPQTPVVMLSMHDETVYALRALRSGARGYVMKRSGGGEVVAAVKEVLKHGTAFSRDVTDQLLAEVTGQGKARRSPIAALTDREFEVLQLLGEGRASRDIAHTLNMSEKTVAVHRLNIRQKLHLRTTAELIRFAIHHV